MRTVNCSAQNFLAAWWRGDVGRFRAANDGMLLLRGDSCGCEARQAALPHLLTERDADGELVLRQRADGACIHLGERGCTVYEQRPAVCRSFDCRAFAAMGIVERCGPTTRPRLGVHREINQGRAETAFVAEVHPRAARPHVRLSPGRPVSLCMRLGTCSISKIPCLVEEPAAALETSLMEKPETSNNRAS